MLPPVIQEAACIPTIFFVACEQGHALATRQAGSTIPCPYVDYDQGFNSVLAAAYGLAPGETIEKLFGKKWGERGPIIFMMQL